jgi:hypothetical protein
LDSLEEEDSQEIIRKVFKGNSSSSLARMARALGNGQLGNGHLGNKGSRQQALGNRQLGRTGT